MSGRFFEYRQRGLEDIAIAIDKVIRDNDSNERDEYGDFVGWGFKPEVIEALATTAKVVKMAAKLVNDADWLLSGDDGEESYLENVQTYLDEQLDESRRAT